MDGRAYGESALRGIDALARMLYVPLSYFFFRIFFGGETYGSIATALREGTVRVCTLVDNK